MILVSMISQALFDASNNSRHSSHNTNIDKPRNTQNTRHYHHCPVHVTTGGSNCSREDPAKQQTGNAIPGLHSSWVGEQQNVLATARPWQCSIARHNLIHAFNKHNIGMILNLQEVGEHSACGPGNLPSCGFTYNPETFMAARIGVYNFSWRDMGVPDLNKMMDIVQVMEYVTQVEGRKIAVHCHAGLGRTGLAIACHLVYTHHYKAGCAVLEVRRDRPGALQTSKQEMFVHIFEQYLSHLRCLYTGMCSAAQPTLQTQSSLSPSRTLQHQQSLDRPERRTPLRQQLSLLRASTKSQSLKSTIKRSTAQQAFPCGLIIMKSVYQKGTLPPKPPRESWLATNQGHQAAFVLDDQDTTWEYALPWTQDLNILPAQFNSSWIPRPPRTYKEAMQWQQRLLHGSTRRTYLNLHRGLAELVLAVIAHATHPSQHPSYLSLPPSAFARHAPNKSAELLESPMVAVTGPVAEGTLMEYSCSNYSIGSRYSLQLGFSEKSHTSPISTPTRSKRRCVKGGPVAEATQPPQPFQTLQPDMSASYSSISFAEQLLICIRQRPQPEDKAVQHLQQGLNNGDYTSLQGASLSVLVQSIGQLMSLLTATAPALSRPTLETIRDNYQSVPYEAKQGPEGPQFLAAMGLFDHCLPADQELLLLFVALLRHTVRVSGVGCEQTVLGLCRWVLGLMLGPQLTTAPATAHEALTSFLWYLLRNDVAYAALVLCRHQRLAGKGKISKCNGKKASSILPAPTTGVARPASRLAMVSITSLDEVAHMTTAQPQPQMLQPVHTNSQTQASVGVVAGHTQPQQHTTHISDVPGQLLQLAEHAITIPEPAVVQHHIHPPNRFLPSIHSAPYKQSQKSGSMFDGKQPLLALLGAPVVDMPQENGMITSQSSATIPSFRPEVTVHDVWI